jgi:hypothetical protein
MSAVASVRDLCNLESPLFTAVEKLKITEKNIPLSEPLFRRVR